MSSPTPTLTQFRLELQPNGLAHLVFDCPNRTMNVFSEAAIHEIGLVAAWLPNADVAGLLIRSGKETAFCAGADLTELGVAYDMIMRAPLRDRFNVAFEHFFRLSRNLRALETAGKPVAAAIAGLALGGGCELALATHYRVLVDDPNVGMGLPESLVGLLPGAGGTQRLPRLIGVEHALPVLLDGARLAGQAALDAGLVQALAPRGDEVAVAEAWLLANPHAQQPWDCDGFDPRAASAGLPLVDAARHKALQETLGHYPAPLAILDCVAFGLPQCFEGAIRSEMSIFAYLIQRLEARNMIQTMFLGKTDYERVARKGAVPAGVAAVVAAVENTLASSSIAPDVLAAIGFAGRGTVAPLRDRALPSFWVETADPVAGQGLELLDALSAVATPLAEGLNEAERRMADYGVVKATGYPAYLGGPLAFGAYRTA